MFAAQIYSLEMARFELQCIEEQERERELQNLPTVQYSAPVSKPQVQPSLSLRVSSLMNIILQKLYGSEGEDSIALPSSLRFTKEEWQQLKEALTGEGLIWCLGPDSNIVISAPKPLCKL